MGDLGQHKTVLGWPWSFQNPSAVVMTVSKPSWSELGKHKTVLGHNATLLGCSGTTEPSQGVLGHFETQLGYLTHFKSLLWWRRPFQNPLGVTLGISIPSWGRPFQNPLGVTLGISTRPLASENPVNGVIGHFKPSLGDLGQHKTLFGVTLGKINPCWGFLVQYNYMLGCLWTI